MFPFPQNHLWVTGSLGHAYRGYKQLLLALHPIRKEHAGRYVCEAKNDAGTHTVVVNVVVGASLTNVLHWSEINSGNIAGMNIY